MSTTAENTTPKKPTAKKTAAKKTSAKKTSAKKTTTKKATARKTTAQKAAPRKTTAAAKPVAPVRESRASWVVPVVGISVPVPAVPEMTLPNIELPKFEMPEVSTVTEVPAHVMERAGDALGQARTFVDDARSSAGRAVVLLREAVGI